MTRIDKAIYTFFIENLSYCALNKQNSKSMYIDLAKENSFKEVKRWFEAVFEDKNYENNPKQAKLIYFYFPDKATVENLDKIFDCFKFKDFQPYFDFCLSRILDTYNENDLELFSCINFFHLIGSLRFFKSETVNFVKIQSVLNDIIESKKLHPLIKYSATQITTLLEVEPKNDPRAYKNLENFKQHYFYQLDSLETSNEFAKYISFYSMYYYSNKYNPDELVKEEYFKKIINDGKIDFNSLHILIPQIASLLIRIDQEKYQNEKFSRDFKELFQVKDENRIDKIHEFQRKIKDVYP